MHGSVTVGSCRRPSRSLTPRTRSDGIWWREGVERSRRVESLRSFRISALLEGVRLEGEGSFVAFWDFWLSWGEGGRWVERRKVREEIGGKGWGEDSKIRDVKVEE